MFARGARVPESRGQTAEEVHEGWEFLFTVTIYDYYDF